MVEKPRVKHWRSGPPSQSPGREVLSELYEKQQLSYGEIANRYEVSSQSVMRWVKAAGISPRTKKQSANNRWGHTKPTAEELRNLYVDQQLSYSQIAERRDVTARSVLKWMRDYSIEPRSKSESISMALKGKPWSPRMREAQMRVRTTAEYRIKLSESHRGEKSHLWLGGQTDAERLRMQGWEWKLRRKECYERDGWICQDCGVHCEGRGIRRIQAHHIISRRDGGGDDLLNLVTLCISCHHKREHAGRKKE